MYHRGLRPYPAYRLPGILESQPIAQPCHRDAAEYVHSTDAANVRLNNFDWSHLAKPSHAILFHFVVALWCVAIGSLVLMHSYTSKRP